MAARARAAHLRRLGGRRVSKRTLENSISVHSRHQCARPGVTVAALVRAAGAGRGTQAHHATLFTS